MTLQQAWDALQAVPAYTERFVEPTQPVITYLNTAIENALVFERSNHETVNMSIQHYGSHHEVDIAVYAPDELLEDADGPIHESDVIDEPLEKIVLSYQEARLLRDLLNREEVQKYLEQE
jgi:hypothetical protein